MTDVRHDPRPAATLAFDRLAAAYDGLTGGEIFRLLRQRTHRAFARHFGRDARVLEIGCGTGLDTSYLASRGCHVVACDPSEEMVTRTMRRLAHDRLETRATVMPCGLEDVQTFLEALAPHEPFDGIVSNFGALNCVGHLAPLGAVVRRHLRPGGTVLLGVMTRVCAVEALYFTTRLQPRLATRRLGFGAVQVPVAGIDVPTFYHRISELCAALGHEVRLRTIEGIGVVVPPPYLETRWQGLPRSVRVAVIAIDRWLAPWPPFNRLGDHVLLHFTKDGTYA
ncbi:MAG TPA: class I SAM-dependent methyltransferase [Vicinamibacterales bacterium]|nr:class I SAM-dependent methyltransferase [Vicinamibacterales bacterium]